MALPNEPITREERYLSAIAGQEVGIPTPITRVEQYLAYIAENGTGGGGGYGGKILGSYDTLAELEEEHPTGSKGDAYLVGTTSIHVYIWVEEDGWTDGGAFAAIEGPQGPKGDDGDDGNGIESITKISTVGKVNTYRIEFTDGTYFDYDVTDGSDVDLTNYYDKTQTNLLLNEKLDVDDILTEVENVKTNVIEELTYTNTNHTYTFNDGMFSLIVDETDATKWGMEFSFLLPDAKDLVGKDIYLLINEPVLTLRWFANASDVTYEFTNGRTLIETTDDGKLYKINFDTIWNGLKAKNPTKIGNPEDYTGTFLLQGWYMNVYTTSFVSTYQVYILKDEIRYKFATQEIVEKDIKNSSNLSGKIWEVCGDSYSSGYFPNYVDKDGNTDSHSEEIYDNRLGLYRTFAYNIAQRNNMRIIMSSIPNTVMALTTDYLDNPTTVSKDYHQPFANKRYKKVSPNADYITIAFGINDCNLCNLGTEDDNTNETFYGAWNVVLDWLVRNRPNSKIGIILYPFESSDTELDYRDFYDAVKKVALKYGIRVLDLWGNDSPLTIYGRYDESVDNAIKAVRHAQYIQYLHPNLKCYEAWTDYVEAWLMTL